MKKGLFALTLLVIATHLRAQVSSQSSGPASSAVQKTASAKGIQFTINGIIDDIGEPADIVFVYTTINKGKYAEVNDTVPLIKGKFSLQRMVTEPVSCIAYLVKKSDDEELVPVVNDIGVEWPDGIKFFLDKGEINIRGANLAKAQITGSASQVEFDQLRKLIDPMETELAAAQKSYQDLAFSMKELSEEEFDAVPEAIELKKKVQGIEEAKYKNYVAFFKAHPDSYVALPFVRSRIFRPYSGKFAIEVFNVLSQKVKSGVEGSKLKKLVDQRSATAIGQLAPDFTQNDQHGKPITLSSLRGKYVFVDFWASWCGPCRAENPTVKEAYAKFHQKNFEILGVSLDNKRELWLEAIEKDGLPWIQVSDLKGFDNQAAMLYQIRAIPQNWLLDPSGKIIATNLKGKDLAAKLAEVLK